MLNRIVLTLLLLTVLSIPVSAESIDTVKQTIVKHSVEMGVDPAVMLSLAKVESSFRQNAVGASGTIGVFQLMPATAKNMGYNPYVLEENIKAGITYYKNMYNMFGSKELAIAAYNSGPVAVKRINAVPNHSKAFVNKVISNYNYYKTQI